MTRKFILEICADSLDYAVAAERAGANRIELCGNLPVGGLTPSAGMMRAAREHLRIPVHALIRPRAGDFVFSAYEFDTMRNDIRAAKQLGMNGVAIGILDPASRIDIQRTRELLDLARPMNVTFHRAFDHAPNLEAALEQVIKLGADRILTSGSTPKAADNIPILARLVQLAANRVTIMPAGGIREHNVAQILLTTSAREIHSSAGASSASSDPATTGNNCSPSNLAEYEQRVRRLISVLDSLPSQAASA